MENEITKTAFEQAALEMEKLLALVTKKGGFENLTDKEQSNLTTVTAIVQSYEAAYIKMPIPDVAKVEEVKNKDTQ